MDGTIDKRPLSRAERHPEKAHRPDNPIRRKPDWIRVRAPNSPEYAETKRLMRQYGLNTVCEEAACPNIGECWKHKHATIMILGSVCTRACTFCNVATGRPKRLDPAMFTKSGVMVGLGEDKTEVLQVMDDLRSAEVDFLTIGQYLQPTPKHHAVDRFVTPEEFESYRKHALGKGF